MPYPNTFCRCVRFNCYAKDARNIFASTPRLHVLVWYKVKYVAGILCKYWHGSANEWDVGSRKRIAHIHLRCLMFQNRVDDLPMWRWCFVRFNLTQILNVHAPFECKDLNKKSTIFHTAKLHHKFRILSTFWRQMLMKQNKQYHHYRHLLKCQTEMNAFHICTFRRQIGYVQLFTMFSWFLV